MNEYGKIISHAGAPLAHEGLALQLLRFLIALLGAQRIGQQPPRLSLRVGITGGQRQRLAPATFGLMGIAFGEAQPSALYPQQRIVRFDAQRAVQCGGGAVEIAVSRQGPGLGHERTSGGRKAVLARRRGRRAW